MRKTVQWRTAGTMLGFALLAAFLAQPGHADDLYVGVGLSSVDLHLHAPQFGQSTGFGARTTGASLLGGARIGPVAAIELAYRDFGKVERSSEGFGPLGPAREATSAHGIEVAVVGRWPLGDRWTFDSRLGAISLQVDGTYFGQIRTCAAAQICDARLVVGQIRNAHSGTAAVLGIGIHRQLTDRLHLRFGLNGYSKVAHTSISAFSFELLAAF